MESFYELHNTIRNYAWGHQSYIPDFLGIANPDGTPMAELWMGAHASAPSQIPVQGEEIPLDRWISSNPRDALGPDIARDFQGLPFLYKLLAAGASLSIQAHPDKKTAEEGFRREEAAGIPRDARTRNYKDDNHKPEIIMALTTFTAMIGFRSPETIFGHFWEIGPRTREIMGTALEDLADGGAAALAPFLRELLTLDESRKGSILSEAMECFDGRDLSWDSLQQKWIPRLAEQFPGDIGILAPLFLHVLELAPGEALYQPARMLHAYLDGFGVELMANSDNVLRGGLTPKNVDVPELLRVLDFHPSIPGILTCRQADRHGWARYDTPAKEFSLAVSVIADGSSAVIGAGTGPSIILVLDGNVSLNGGGKTMEMKRGESAFVPWSSPEIEISGTGRVSLATVNR